MSNSLDPDQDRHSVCPDRDPNSLQILQTTKVNAGKEIVKEYTSHFSKSFLGKISAILPICIMKKSIWKFCVNGTVSVTGTRVNIYQIS